MEGENKQLYSTSDPYEIIEALIACGSERQLSVSKYKLLSRENNINIISNVPSEIYEKENLMEYSTPISPNYVKPLMEFLQSYIDLLQYSEVSDQTVLEIGETFNLNKCYDNSIRLFEFFNHLKNLGNIPKGINIQIVIGYVQSKIPFGTNIGNIVVKNDSLFLHDWHVWNLIDSKFLIDLSLFQKGVLLPFNSKLPSWGLAKDHVSITPPNGLLYFGKHMMI